MRKFARLKVSPHIYEVRAEPGLSRTAGLSGACGTDISLIVYDPAESEQNIKETLLHEALHAVFTQTELDRIYSDDEEERIVWSLAPRILAFLKDNPRFIKWLAEG